MRKNYLIYLAISFMTFCLSTSAADQANAEEALKKSEYRRVIVDSLELPRYSSEITSPDIPEQYNQGKTSYLCDLPSEIIVSLLSLLDTKSLLLGYALTCQQLHIISKAPIFTLNPENLTPYMHRAIPLWLLKNKINNSKNGIELIANDKTVTQQTLIELIGKNRLEKEATKISIPATLENLSEEELTNLYPKFKIALAAGHQADTVLNVMAADHQSKYLGGQPRSTAMYYLYTLAPTNNSVYTSGLYNLFNALPINSKAHQDYQPKGIIARKLLEAEKWVGVVAYSYYTILFNQQNSQKSPLKEGLCHKLIKWILLKNTFDVVEIGSALDACITLKSSILAATAAQKLLKSHCPPEKISQKLAALTTFCQHTYGKQDNSEIMSEISSLASNLASDEQWAPLKLSDKIRTLSLLAFTDLGAFRRQSRIFLEFKPNLAEKKDSLFLMFLDHIHKCKHETQHKEWVNYYLDYPPDVLMIQGRGSLLKFIQKHAMPIDRTKAISLIKAYIDHPNTTDQHKLDTLTYLSSLPERESDYIETHLKFLNTKNLNQSYFISYGMIYGNIGNDDLFNQCYQTSIDGLIYTRGNHHPETLEYLSKQGLKINDLSELKQKDPRVVLEILQKANYAPTVHTQYYVDYAE